ncbi:hypothetical protein F506_02550 [Herbaspirillum hiltneri N3]|uniref:TnsA endonuclease N-terminal domain-containing protein n=1 Tax=Herbaspirillum hiltneri N3 TaxID=1262470 RepID=A0ABM5UWW8_9BURK|nr:TnsA endonuclease N-terminal domain-containing protein [Herbaspirillum hiltneri]AKZ61698.1 hypothetical protein F506_02550 [Herbaspirillum hiltneri N3]
MGVARKVVHRSTHRMVGAIPCLGKNPKLVEWESRLERNAIDILRFHPDVTYIDSQVRWLEYIDQNDQVHRHCPDLYVIYKDKPLWIEVKFQKFVAEYQERTHLITELVRLKSEEYTVMDDTVILIEPRLSNIQLLLRYQLLKPSVAIKSKAEKLFDSGFSASIENLIEEHGFDLLTLYSLLCHHYLRTDLHTQITRKSIVSRFVSGQEILSDEEILN